MLHNDPLWTQNADKTISYGFAASVFYLAIFYGFFTSFFFNNFAWQLTGLIIITTLFGFFALVNSQFNSTIIKIFFVLFALLLLAFLFLLAALGSTVSTSPCGQEGLGYLGIGFLYALVVLSLIASLYLVWFTLFNMYSHFWKDRPII